MGMEARGPANPILTFASSEARNTTAPRSRQRGVAGARVRESRWLSSSVRAHGFFGEGMARREGFEPPTLRFEA